MRARLFWTAIVAASLQGTACLAQEDVEWVEQVPFGLSILASPQVALFRDSLTLYVSASALDGHGPRGRIHVAVPDGLELVSGDTTFTVSVRRHFPPHQIKVRAMHPGVFEVVGRLIVTSAPGDEDFFDVGLPISVSGDTLTPGQPIVHRIERSSGGRRFRYAGTWLIPVGDQETFDAPEFEHGGVRVQPVETARAVCAECQSSRPDTVLFVVVVDPSGKITASQPMGLPGRETPPDASTIKAARAALSKWRFRPAQLRGRPVTDWMYVRVPVSASN